MSTVSVPLFFHGGERHRGRGQAWHIAPEGQQARSTEQTRSRLVVRYIASQWTLSLQIISLRRYLSSTCCLPPTSSPLFSQLSRSGISAQYSLTYPCMPCPRRQNCGKTGRWRTLFLLSPPSDPHRRPGCGISASFRMVYIVC